MDKKKVLILITKSNWGGAQRYVFDIAVNLPREQFDVEIMAGSKGILIDKLNTLGIKASGNLSIGRDVSIVKDIKAFFELISILRKSKPDILHLNSSKIGGLGAVAGRIAKVPRIVFTSHGWAFNENRSFFSKIIIKFLHWVTIYMSHETIAVSVNLMDQMSGWPKISEKISVIHNAIKVEPIFSKVNAESELKKASTILKDRLNTLDPKKTVVIGTVGELHHIKGYEYSIKATAELIQTDKIKNSGINILYVIIGTGEEKNKIDKLIKDLKVENNVILLGYVQDAFQYFKSFDIFLLSSLSESFGYVLLEAGVASLPVIATAVGGIPEIIDDMQNGVLIQAKKSTEIKHALEFYLSHKTVRKEHGVALQKKILSEFSIEKMIEKTINVYTKKHK
jgi:glycosyltransferase involved in cell wall biosynthesis